MNKSDSITKLSEALSKAQGELKHAPMNSINPFLKNKYADLGSVIETAKPVLVKHGLAVTQLVTGDGARVGVETVMTHSSGEWISETVLLAITDEKGKSDAQVAGSIVTYLRRYALTAILGMYADEDTDGNKPAPKQQPQSQQPANGNAPTRDELLAKFAKYKTEAESLDIEVLPLAEDATNEQIIGRGKNLAAMIASRKKAAQPA